MRRKDGPIQVLAYCLKGGLKLFAWWWVGLLAWIAVAAVIFGAIEIVKHWVPG